MSNGANLDASVRCEVNSHGEGRVVGPRVVDVDDQTSAFEGAHGRRGSALVATASKRNRLPLQPELTVAATAMIIGLASAATVVIVFLASANDGLAEPFVRAGLTLWVFMPYVGAGILAWRRRPDSWLGPLMLAAGLATFLTSLAWSNVPALSTVGLALDFLPPVLFVHVFLAFPSGRPTARLERLLVLVAYATSVGLSLVRMLLGAFGPANLLSVVDKPVAPAGLERAQLIAISTISVAAIVIWAIRGRGRVRPLRRSRAVLVDSFVVALAMIAALFVTAAFNGPGFETLRRATHLVIGIAPVAFLIELGQARLARANVGALLVELGDDPQPADLRDALSRALRDPTLTLAYWLPHFNTWADTDGRQVQLPDDGVRATTLIDRRGVPIAALVHSPALREEPELVDAVAAAAGIALENGRLQAELRAQVDELAGSRARVIGAEQRERQRLERNLHDGAQQRLVSLSLELGLLEQQLAGNMTARARLDGARRTIALSLAELRDVARGIHPAVVSAHGLAVALEDLAANALVPVRLDITLAGRVAEPLEVAAYYVVCESLANVAKHASAASAVVKVDHLAGLLVVEVSDDGVGGADSEQGSGLRGLADRVEALGGRLQVWSPPGGGTRVRGEFPCER
jgi:signal transduction histidine kinase